MGIREFTASAYVIENGSALLVFHPKVNKWLPPGGHMEPGETPPEAAIREVKEETGLDVEILTQENLWINESNAVSFERPFLCLLENIPQYRNTPPHQHIDFVYIARPVGGKLETEENHPLQWFTLDEIDTLDEEVIYQETRESLCHLLSPSYVSTMN